MDCTTPSTIRHTHTTRSNNLTYRGGWPQSGHPLCCKGSKVEKWQGNKRVLRSPLGGGHGHYPKCGGGHWADKGQFASCAFYSFTFLPSYFSLQRPTFTLPGAVFSGLGAVFRNVKVGLFIYHDARWPFYESLPAALFTLFPFSPFTFHHKEWLLAIRQRPAALPG